MKTIPNLICLLVFLLILEACKKNKSSDNSANPQPSTLSPDYVSLIKGSWSWDSTSILNYDTLKYVFNSSQLKTYHSNSVAITCTAVCNFSLNFATLPYNNSGNGSGYYSTYSAAINNSSFSAAQLTWSGTRENANDSLINYNDNSWAWYICPSPAGNEMNIQICCGNNTPIVHRCSNTVGFLAMFGAFFTIETLNTNHLVLKFKDSPNPTTVKIYFHK
jgi:hypothetical protein